MTTQEFIDQFEGPCPHAYSQVDEGPGETAQDLEAGYWFDAEDLFGEGAGND